MEKEKVLLFDLKYSVPILKAFENPKRLKELNRIIKHPGTRDKTVRMLKNHGLLTPTYMEKNDKMYLGFYASDKGKKVLELVKEIEKII